MKQCGFLVILLFVCVMLAGCSTAGPFVTNISSDGQGGLVIEKTMVEYNAFLGTVSDKDATSATIQVIPRDKLK